MFHPPILDYNGVCFVLSSPGRHDTTQLISGRSGEYFNSCLKLAQTTRFNSAIKDLKDPSPYPPNTKVVVMLGALAQRTVNPTLSLNEARGYCYRQFDHPSCPVFISSYDPQDCMDRRQYQLGDTDEEDIDEENDPEVGKEKEHSPTRRKNWKYWLCQDIKKALDISRNGFKPLIKLAKFETYLPSANIVNLLESYKNKTIFFDIETNENYNITVFSFSTDWNTIYTVPITRYNQDLAYDEFEICRILRALAIAFRDNTIVIHNSLFDLFILVWRYKIPPPKLIEDTMVMQHRVAMEVEKSLGHCGSYLTHEEYHKNENCFNPKNQEQECKLWKYNGKDVAMLAIIYQNLKQIISDKGLQDSVYRGNRLISPFLLQTCIGIQIDNDFKVRSFEELEKKKAQYLRLAKILCGYDMETLGSWQRVAKYLYDYKGLPRPSPTFKDGILKYEEQTASATLYKLRSKHYIPFIDLLLHYRAIGKQAGFLKFKPWSSLKDQWSNNYNPTRFTSADSITGTDTLRNSSRKLFDFWGSNKQNVEKALRRVCIPDIGKEFVQTDQSGAEALVVAYLAPKGKYRQLLELGVKLYNFVALHIFKTEWEKILKRDLKEFVNAPVDKLTKIEGFKELNALIKSSDDWPASRRFYYICKMVVLAANYGMRGPTFQVNMMKKSEGKVIISLKEAKYYLDFFHDLFPEIHQWHSATQLKLMTNNKILENLFGDRREFMDQWDDSLFKKAYAFVPQSTVGMLTNIAIGELQEMLDNNTNNIRELGVDILANGHDAILSQCRLGCGEYLGNIQEKLLAKTFFKGLPNEFTMRSESTIGPSWDLKSYSINTIV